jgi:hypothetical protein
MSSSNLIKLALIKEAVYGITPALGNFKTSRFVSESMSGSPQTAESAQIRADRLSNGQVVTGIEVKGSLDYELAKEDVVDLLLESAMLNDWDVKALVSVDLTIVAATKIITRASGSFITDGIVKGDILTLAGFTETENNTEIVVSEVTDATHIKFVGPATIVDEVGAATSFKRADKLTIGTVKRSFSMEKLFTDLTTKSLIYKGMTVSQMKMSIAHGAIVNGSFDFMGNDYYSADIAGESITNGRTIDNPSTSNSMNGSVDMSFLMIDSSGVAGPADFCINKLDINLNNNLTPQNCIGTIAPKDYSPGTAQVGIDLSAYLSNTDWNLLDFKMTQETFSIGFIMKNLQGFYGVFIPAIQVSFDDPSSKGANQDVMLEMKGTAKVGANGESSLIFYRG